MYSIIMVLMWNHWKRQPKTVRWNMFPFGYMDLRRWYYRHSKKEEWYY